MFICKLKKLRSDKGVSQRELSDQTGIRYPTISEMERCATKACSLENLDKLCSFFNCTLNDVYEFAPVQANEIVIPLEVNENGKVNPFIEYSNNSTATKTSNNEIGSNQINKLVNIFMELDPINQANLLIYANSLQNKTTETN